MVRYSKIIFVILAILVMIVIEVFVCFYDDFSEATDYERNGQESVIILKEIE